MNLILNVLKRFWRESLIALLLILTFGLYRVYTSEKEESSRQRSNVESLSAALHKENLDFKFRDSLNGASIKQQEYTILELKKLRDSDIQTIKDLNLKLSRVEGYAKVEIETIYKDIEVPIYIKDSIGHIKYESKWLTIDAITIKDSIFRANKIESRDSIMPILYREPKWKFLGISIGTKGYELKLINFNPNSKIKYAEWIKLSKK